MITIDTHAAEQKTADLLGITHPVREHLGTGDLIVSGLHGSVPIEMKHNINDLVSSTTDGRFSWNPASQLMRLLSQGGHVVLIDETKKQFCNYLFEGADAIQKQVDINRKKHNPNCKRPILNLNGRFQMARMYTEPLLACGRLLVLHPEEFKRHVEILEDVLNQRYHPLMGVTWK